MKMASKVTVPLTALMLAAGGGITYYLTSNSRADNLHHSVSGPVTEGHVAQAYVGDPDNPATWKLPIEAYMPTKSQASLVSNARDDLIDQCMDKAGYPDWSPAPDLPKLGGKTLTDWRYGIHDAELAAKRGYHPEAQEQQAYEASLEEGAVDESGAPDETVKKCASEVDGSVPTAQPAYIVQQVSGEAFGESRKDPEVVAAFAQWSTCMHGKGYSYKEPMEANDEPRFADPNQVTQLEIDTAAADIICRNEANVARTWFDAESRMQQTKIAEHLDEFNAAANETKRIVAKARSV